MGLRIAYIGAGGFSNNCMFPQFARHGVELAAICDLVEEKARRAQQQYGFGRFYTDFRQMLEQERPDAVFCVGGPKVHYPVGMEVLDRGFPLYVQKSPAPTAAATREMAELAAKRGVVCHVGFNLRSAPAVRQARAIVAGEEFGPPLMGVFRYGLTFGATMADVVMDQHCHLVDLARFFLGDVASAEVIRSSVEGRRDYVVALDFESGAVGTLNFTSGQIPEKEFIYFEVTGRGSFVCNHDVVTTTWRRPLRSPWWSEPQADHVFGHGGYGSTLLMLEAYGYVPDVAGFLAAVKGAAEDPSPIADAVATMALCEEILRQMEA